MNEQFFTTDVGAGSSELCLFGASAIPVIALSCSDVNLPVKYFSVKNPDFLKNGKIWKVN